MALRFLVIGLLVLHSGLLAWSGYRHSPVVAEVGHLPAGISHWQFGRFDAYRVNPPLVDMVAAVPVMLVRPTLDWKSYSTDPLRRCETPLGTDFLAANGPRAFWLYTLGRWACIPFSVFGAIVCFWWARDLYGIPSGIMALTIWCFCPNILGNAALIMPDVPSAAMAVAACYSFWRWNRQPGWAKAASAGIVLGLAVLTKITLLVLYPVFIMLWIIDRLITPVALLRRGLGIESGMICVSFLLSVNLLNLGYGFADSFRPLRKFEFQSRALTGAETTGEDFPPGNRFAASWLGRCPMPVPADYVLGGDAQKLDFERGIRSYINGKWSERGWWWFYIYALTIKVPLGTLLLIALSIAVRLSGIPARLTRANDLFLLGPAVALLVLVSSQTGFSIHFRYALPAFPFLFIWGSKAAFAFSGRHLVLAPSITLALLWSVASSLWYYPHSLSYFNEFAGGPEHGHEHLVDSCISWGQDILYLKDWYEAHPEARPLKLAAFGLVTPELAGIDFELPPPLEPNATPDPGWYVVDVNYLHGSRRPAPAGIGSWKALWNVERDLQYFRGQVPVAMIGYAMFIYHIPDRALAIIE